METKNNILENLLHLATEYDFKHFLHIEESKRKKQYLISGKVQVGSAIRFLSNTITSIKDEIFFQHLENIYDANKRNDIKSIELLKEEIKNRCDFNIKPQLDKYFFGYINWFIDEFAVEKHVVYHKHLSNLTKKAKAFYIQGNHVETEKCLKLIISYSYTLTGTANRLPMHNFQEIIFCNRIQFPIK